uniref:Uncharacterized protein n=1 Tax=Panagrolaimus superbus TaxID=310955 RepID=A0A914YF96_9BILA
METKEPSQRILHINNKRKASSTFSQSEDGEKRGRPINSFNVPDIFYDPNEKQIAALEDENRYLRVQMNALQNRVNRVEKIIEDILAGRSITQMQNTGDVGKYVEITPPETIPRIPSTSVSLPKSLSNIEDAPSWTWISEATARDIYFENHETTIFVRQIFKAIFTKIHAFQLQLPLDIKSEYEKICQYILRPPTEAQAYKIRKIIATEIHYQREKLRTRITHLQTPAIAMSESTFPLKQIGNIWVPVNKDVPFERLPGTNVQAWPILINHGQRVDTMFAQRRKTTKERSQWQYFIITKDGVMIYCSKE